MGSQLLSYLGANANGVRVLVRELRKQMDNHVVELAEELMSDAQHLPKDPDGYVYKVDQKLLSSAVRPPPLSCVDHTVEDHGVYHDSHVYKVDQKLLSTAVRPFPGLSKA